MTRELEDQLHRDAHLGARVRRISETPTAQLGVLALVMLQRNLLELLGPLTGSHNFCCFAPNYSSFLNTFTYELLLVYGGMFMVHRLLRGNPEQLRTLIPLSILFMLPLFVFVPFVNLVLNYHGPCLPLWPLPWLYLPMGSVLGFAAILILLPLVLRRLYPTAPFARIVLSLGVGFVAMFLWTYVVGIQVALQPASELFGAHVNRMDLYSVTFLTPLLFSFPLFVRTYFPPQRRRDGWLLYAGIVGLTLVLIWASNLLG